MRLRTPCSLCLVIGLCMGWPRPAASQSYQFTKVLDGLTPRPDRVANFFVGLANATPAYDGKFVVFRDPGPQGENGTHSGMFSFNTQDGTFRKLADLDTPLPAGTHIADLQLYDTAPSVRNGAVVFLARDSSTGTNQQGLYSMPAGGGQIAKIADYTTPNPTGGEFTVFDAFSKQVGGFSFDGATVAFNANGSNLTLGNYWARPDGSAVGLLADNLHPYAAQSGPVMNFRIPAVSGTHAVMLGDGGDPDTGYHGVYLARVGGDGSVTELVNSNQPLPGNPNAGFHTRFDSPVLALDGTLVAFRASDSKSNFFGLYATDLTSHVMTAIADANSNLPGLGKLGAIANTGVAVSQGAVLFRAADLTGRSALYVWRNGRVTRIVGSGDSLGGQVVQGVSDPGPAALSGAGFVFIADFGSARARAIYLARPSANAVALASVANSASYGTTAVAPGEIVTLFGTGTGPSALTRGEFDANNCLPTLLAGVRVLFSGFPAPLIYVSDKQIAAIVPFGIANLPSAQVTVEYAGGISPAIAVPVANTMPGVFSADFSGGGQGAIQNSDQSYNGAANPAGAGSTIVLWVTGLGPLNPAQADGTIVGAPMPALQHPVSVTIGGQPAEVVYQGPAPGAVAGLYQVNCIVPPGTKPGAAVVVVTADGKRSQPNLTVAVQ